MARRSLSTSLTPTLGSLLEKTALYLIWTFSIAIPSLLANFQFQLSGLAVDMVSILEEALGFTALRVTPSPSTPFGRRMKNGTHTGILGIVSQLFFFGKTSVSLF